MPVSALDQVLLAFDSGDVITLLCTSAIVPGHSAQSSKSPVEVGSETTDHVKVNPTTLSLTIFLSEMVGQEENETYDSDFVGSHIELRERFIQGLNARDPVTVDLGPDKGIYPNMILLDVSPIWTEGEGKSPTLTLQMEELVYHTTKTRKLAPPSKQKAAALPAKPVIFDQGAAAIDLGLLNPQELPATSPLLNELKLISMPEAVPDWARL